MLKNSKMLLIKLYSLSKLNKKYIKVQQSLTKLMNTSIKISINFRLLMPKKAKDLILRQIVFFVCGYQRFIQGQLIQQSNLILSISQVIWQFIQSMIDFQATTWKIQGKNRQPSLIKDNQLVNCQTYHESFDGLINGQEPSGIKDINFAGGSKRGESNPIVTIQNYIDFQNEDNYILYLGKSIKILGLNINKLDIRSKLSLDSIKSIQQEKTEKIYVYNKRSFFTQTYYPIPLIRKIKTCSIIYCDYDSDGKILHHLIFLDKDGLIFMRICYIDWQTDRKRTQNFLSEKLKSNFTVILNANLTKNNIDLTLYDILQSININRIQANRTSQQKYKKTQEEIRNRIIVFSQQGRPIPGKNYYQKSRNFCIRDVARKNVHFKVVQNSKILVLSEFEIPDSLVQTLNQRMNDYTQVFNILKQQIFNSMQFNFEQMLNRNALFAQLFTLYFNCTVEIKTQTQINQKRFKDRLNNQIMNLFLDAREAFFEKKQKNRRLENSHFYGQLDNCNLCLVCLVKYNKANKQSAQSSDNSKNLSSKQEFIHKKIKSNSSKHQDIDQEKSIEEEEAPKKSKKKLKINYKLKNQSKNEEQKSDRNDDIRKRKTKYKCIGCSITFEKDIPLCILCFKQFHNDISKYLPTVKKRYMKKHKQHTKFMALMCSENLINHGRQRQQCQDNDSKHQEVQVKIQQSQNQKIQKNNIEIMNEWKQLTFQNEQKSNLIVRQSYIAQRIMQENQSYGQMNYVIPNMQQMMHNIPQMMSNMPQMMPNIMQNMIQNIPNMQQMIMLAQFLKQSHNVSLQQSHRIFLQSMFRELRPQLYEQIRPEQLKKQQQ